MSEDNNFHLSDNWIDHLRSTLSVTNEKLTFNQISLALFQGHTNAVQKFYVFDCENSFITSSIDKTLKLWSIKTSENIPNFQHMYSNHTKSIKDFIFMPSSNLIVSTDSIIHVIYFF